MTTKTWPVTVLTGFLGSGKTTLVNRLLKERPGTRFGLIVNEFGEAALESQLLEVRNHPLYELPSGCLCCVSDGDLRQALEALVARDATIDHIVVEASGLSSPGPLLGVLTQGERFALSGTFCLVDAAGFLAHEPQFAAVRRQLSFADAVLLTKTDLATDKGAAVRHRLDELKPGVKVLDTAQRLPWSALFATESQGGEASNAPRERPRRFTAGGRHHDADVLEFGAAEALDPDRVAAVFAGLEPGILRAKGVLYLEHPSGHRYKYLVQYTGTQKQLYSRPWTRGETPRTDLVFLGSSFDAAALKAQLDACRVGAPA